VAGEKGAKRSIYAPLVADLLIASSKNSSLCSPRRSLLAPVGALKIGLVRSHEYGGFDSYSVTC
jgi:hypothetical protein